MPVIYVLNILQISIHAIGTEQTRGNDNCCANMHAWEQDDPMQKTVKAEKCYTKIDCISKSNNRIKPRVMSRISYTKEYFLSEPSYDTDKKMSAETTQQLHKEFKDGFNGICYFNGTFSLQLKLNQAPLRCVAYALQKPFKEERERLQKQDIKAPWGIYETSEWCKSFVLVPKANGKVRLCLEPAQLNQALIRPTHRGPTLNNILPKLNNAKYLSVLDWGQGITTWS